MKGYFSLLWAVFKDFYLSWMGFGVLTSQVIFTTTLRTLQIDFNSH